MTDYSRIKRDYLHFGSLVHYAVLLFVAIFSIILIYCCGDVFMTSVKYEKETAARIQAADSIRKEFYVECKQFVSEMSRDDVPKDAADNNYRHLLSRIIYLEQESDNMLADIRQEGNNLINKSNGWLAFWITILAMFCGVVPMVIQYILTRKSKKEIEDLIEETQMKATNCQLQMTVSNISIEQENKILNSGDREEFIKIMKRESRKSLNELIDKIDKSERIISIDKEIHLVNALMQYCRLLDLLKITRRGRRIKDLNLIQARLKELISDMMNHNGHSREEIWNRFNDLIPSLQDI